MEMSGSSEANILQGRTLTKNMNESSHLTSMDVTNEDGLMKKFISEYSSADKFAREVSEFRGDISIPAYNELRYAGYHLTKSIGCEGNVANYDEIRKAISHCERSKYESAEAGIMAATRIINNFRGEYKKIVIKEIIECYPIIIRKLRDARNLIIEGREDDKTHPQRANSYMEKFKELKGYYEILEDHTDDLNAKLNQAKNKSMRFYFRMALTVLAMLLAAIFS